MKEICAVTSDLNRYLADIDKEESRQALIDRRTADRLLDEFSPGKTEMVSEALSEISDAMAEAIAFCMAMLGKKSDEMQTNANQAIIGRLVAGAINNYCEKLARDSAEASVNDASCKHCYDQGCRRCDEDCHG